MLDIAPKYFERFLQKGRHHVKTRYPAANAAKTVSEEKKESREEKLDAPKPTNDHFDNAAVELPETLGKTKTRTNIHALAPKPDSSSGTPFNELYKVGTELGKGAFSVVKRAVHREQGTEYAIKTISRNNIGKEDDVAILGEVNILREFDHPNVVTLYDFFQEPDYYYLVIECLMGGELFDRVVANYCYSEKDARDTCKVLLEAVQYCHSRRIAHRDLKPENLLLKDEENDSDIKLADFGFATKVVTPNSLRTQCGTPGYVAPEILEGVAYDTKCDMWSIGVILYILLGGYPPFIEKNQRLLFRRIRKGDYEFHEEYWSAISSDAKSLISSLLKTNPAKRMSAVEASKHAWFTADNDEALRLNSLEKNLDKLKEFNAARRFKAGVNAVIAINKMNSLGENFIHSLRD